MNDFNGSTGYDFSDIRDDLDADAHWGQPAKPEPEPFTLDPEMDITSGGDEIYTEPDASVIGKPRRITGAATYEKKLRALNASLIKLTVQNPGTAPDAAALIIYGPKAAQSVGELAATDPRIGRGIDMLLDGAENPYLNAALALWPLATQIARNHEPVIEPKTRGFKIPFLMKKPFHFPFKFGIKLSFLRGVTHRPEALADHVLTNPDVIAAFAKQGVPIAWGGKR